MKAEFWNIFVTIVSGVGVYILCELYAEFVLRPIQEYKKLKAKVAKLLVLHAQYYSNPRFYDENKDYPEWSSARDETRELAAEVAAFLELKPNHVFVFYAIPSKKHLLEAQDYLIGLSHSFFTSRNGEERCLSRVYEYPDIIRQNMGIATKRQKKKRYNPYLRLGLCALYGHVHSGREDRELAIQQSLNKLELLKVLGEGIFWAILSVLYKQNLRIPRK